MKDEGAQAKTDVWYSRRGAVQAVVEDSSLPELSPQPTVQRINITEIHKTAESPVDRCYDTC